MRRLSFLLTLLMLCSMVSFADDVLPIGHRGDQIRDHNPGASDKLVYFIDHNDNTGVGYTCVVRPVDNVTGELTIPATITDSTKHVFKVVRAERFSLAPNITKVTFPEGLEEITEGCFNRCYGLTEINIPSTVTKIGNTCFFECTKLANINVAAGNNSFKIYTDGDGNQMLLSKDGKDLYYYFATNTGETCYVPSSVTHILQGAITSNPYFTYVSIPATVTQIDFPAIYFNTKNTTISVIGTNSSSKYRSVDGILVNGDESQILTVPYLKRDNETRPYTLTIPEGKGFKQINESAFLYCRTLNKVNIAEGITTIQDHAFSNCIGLTDLNMPKSMTSIVGDPFDRCNLLSNIFVEDGNTVYGSVDGVLTNSDKTRIIRYPLHHNYVDGSVTYVIPDGIKEIGNQAFKEVAIKEVTISNTVEKIDAEAFNNCTKLETVTFEPGSQLTEISRNVFQNCSKLSQITIPASVTKICQGAFYNSGLEHVTVEGTALNEIEAQAFGHCYKLQDFNLDANSSLETIGTEIFLDDALLKSFTLPKNVTNLADAAFHGCKGMTEFTFAEGSKLTRIGKNVFQNCESLQEIDIPESVTEIGDQAFNSCKSLKEVSISKNTTSIDYGAFQLCDGLQNFRVDADNPKFSQVDGMLTTFNNEDPKSTKQSELYIMPPGRVHSDYTLLPTIESIGTRAFYFNKKLTSIAIPSNVGKIKAEAFYGCDKLNTVTCLTGDAPQLEDGAFDNALTDDATLYYRKRDEDTYKTWGITSAGEDKFKHRFPSFNFAYQRVDRQNPDGDLVEYIPLSDNAAAVVSNESVDPQTAGGKDFKTSQKTTLIIPEKVSHTYTKDGETKTFTYTTMVVYDNAFTTNDKLHTLTFYGPITYIGVNAFHKRVDKKGSTSNETTTEPEQQAFSDGIYFVHDFPEEGVLFAQEKYNLDNSYKAFADDQKVYVKYSQKDNYEKALNSSLHPCDVETDIPIKANAANTRDPWGHYLYTLCREFATDFSDGDYEAYVPVNGTYRKVLPEDSKKGVDHFFVAQATTWVPGFAGMIIKNRHDSNEDSFYRIAEWQESTGSSQDNGGIVLRGVYEDTNLTQSSDPVIFGMKNSIFYKMSSTGGTVNAFRSYLTLPKSVLDKNSAKVSVSFIDGDMTGILDVKTDAVGSDCPVYDLCGRKVAESYNSVKAESSLPPGVYIVGGKKVILK